MIRLVYSLWMIRVLFTHPFPKTRRAIRAAQKRVTASKAIGRVS